MAEEKFVILHAKVGDWCRGDVVDRSWFDAKNIPVERLMGLGALRGATQLERTVLHVDLQDNQVQNQSLQHQLAMKDAKISELQARIAELEEEKTRRTSAAQQVIPARGVDALMAAKEQHIHDLQNRLNAESQKATAATVAAQHEMEVAALEAQRTATLQEARENEAETAKKIEAMRAATRAAAEKNVIEPKFHAPPPSSALPPAIMAAAPLPVRQPG